MAEPKLPESGYRSAVKTAAAKDIITGAVVIAGIILFVRNGSLAMLTSIESYFGNERAADTVLQTAVFLNVALILFGWRRYRDLSREIEQRAGAERRATELASSDPLTGFHNRRSLADCSAEMLQKALKSDKAIAVIVFDLDHFKMINDLHGHSVGDALLRRVATEMTQLTSPNSLLARLGGDEFVCVMTYDIGNRAVVEDIAQSIVMRLAEPFDLSGIKAHISVSVGIAHSADGNHDFESLLRHADIAMYAAKRNGRSRAVWFDTAMEAQLHRRAEFVDEMRSGIAAGQFEPYFEKQVELATGKLLGFEVLARWNHPVRGLILPTDFIQIAEESNMISDLSLAVIRRALVEARDWDPALSISVNIAPGQMQDPWFAHKIIKILTETGFPAARLEVEITEAALYDNMEVAKSVTGSLKNQGVRIALDDFGTGFSSLAHLRAIPFDRIKMDKSFAMSLNDSHENAAVINAVNQLGDSLAITVSVKGIEDASAQATLNEIGCTKGQGWYYGKPTSISATRALLAQQNLLPPQADEAEWRLDQTGT